MMLLTPGTTRMVSLHLQDEENLTLKQRAEVNAQTKQTVAA